MRDVIESACDESGAKLFIPDMSRFKIISENIDGTDIDVSGLEIHTPFLGEHQVKNAAVAIELAKVLRTKGFDIDSNKLISGFKKAFIPARMEILSKRPLCLLDGGHNPGCAEALRDALTRFVPQRRIAIMGMMSDKDSACALAAIGPMFSRIITVRPDNPRAMSAEELANTARAFCPDSCAANSMEEALALSLDGLTDEDALIVCGSFYLAGELRPLLLEQFK